MSFSIKDFTAQLNKSGGLAKTNRYFLDIPLPTALATTYTSAPAVKEHFKYMVLRCMVVTSLSLVLINQSLKNLIRYSLVTFTRNQMMAKYIILEHHIK